MRFKSQERQSPMPRIDLIPMLNVMVAVLAFFVMVSMNLTTTPEGIDVELPDNSETETLSEETVNQSLIVELKSSGLYIINEREYRLNSVLQALQTYLNNNTKNQVFLVADPEVSYEQVIQSLSAMQEVGKDRVSLGIEPR